MALQPNPIDLTTVSVCSPLVNITAGSDSDKLQRFITATSRSIIRILGFNPIFSSFTEVRDGNNSNAMVMRNKNIYSVSSVAVIADYDYSGAFPFNTYIGSNLNIPPSVGGGPGFLFDANRVMLIGYHFFRGVGNVTIQYQAGEVLFNRETYVLGTTTENVLFSAQFIADKGVAYGSGVSFVKVASSPTVGQYTVANGVYTFNGSDVGATVVITYNSGHVPEDLAQICADIVAQEYSRTKHIDKTSEGSGSQHGTYANVDIPHWAWTRLKIMSDRTPLP